MDTESEPYVRLATLQQVYQVVAELNTARSLADTLQAVTDGVVKGLGFEIAVVNLVRADGDLVVAAVSGSAPAEALMAGRVGSRTSWDRRLNMAQHWGTLRFIPHVEGWVLDGDDVPQWYTEGPPPRFPDEWHPGDRLYAPMYASPAGGGELIGVISVDKPANGRHPGPWGREALQMYAFQAAIAISNARLRANMQRALVRLEREQQALRASEESFRQAFEYAPSGMAIAEMGGDQHGKVVRANDALCRLLGRPAAVMRRYSFSDLVHPEDVGLLLRTSAEGGRAELRLSRRDGTYVWVSLRNSVVADTTDGPRFLLTHVEDIEERKSRELTLAHRASHDSLTGLPNSAELRTRLAGRLCSQPQDAAASDHVDAYSYGYGYGPDEMAAPLAGRDHHTHAVSPESSAGGDSGGKGLAVLFCDLDGFKLINDRHGHHTGDAVLIEVARRLSSVVRDGDTVARLGGDEFVVLADGLARDDAADLADRLLNAIIPPIRVDGRSVKVGASFGIGWAGCGMTADEVLKSADQRMYVEKRSRSAGRPRNEDDGSDRRGEGGPDSRSGKRPDNRPDNRNSNGNRSHRRAG
jgi:diguanylate cyclase (GGDEF)-like protein/PAS domain S-box-containing protein